MTGVVRTREVAVYRWVFFSLFLVGLALLTFSMTTAIMFDDSTWYEYAEALIQVGLVCSCAGGLGLIVVHVMQRGCFVRTMRGCVIFIIVLGMSWLVYAGLLWLYGSAYRLLSFFSPLAFCSVMTAMVVIAIFILSLETKSKELQIGKRMVAYSFATCTVVQYVFVWFGIPTSFDLLAIAILIGWAATLLGLAGLCVAMHFENKPRGKLVRTIPNRVKMKMTCPQCKQWLETPSGPARCEDCGLRLIIEIKEPRCNCGYLLYELQGNVCPECGRDTTIGN